MIHIQNTIKKQITAQQAGNNYDILKYGQLGSANTLLFVVYHALLGMVLVWQCLASVRCSHGTKYFAQSVTFDLSAANSRRICLLLCTLIARWLSVA